MTPKSTPLSRDAKPALAALAAVIAVLGWAALSIEFERSVSISLSEGRGWGEALFLYFRFFTILTNFAVASLMSFTAVRLATAGRLPRVRILNAIVVYVVVTCVTYEWLLRSQWHPQGLQFITDLLIHDVVPALTVVFWLFGKPSDRAFWSDATWMLAYPAIYFISTLVAGATGRGYPYGFLDAERLGLASVMIVGVVFLSVFYGLGLAVTAISRARFKNVSAETWPLAP